MKKNVFISYNHSNENTEAIRNIATKLSEMGLKVWLDQYELKPGDSILKNINNAIDNSSYVIVVVSPNDKKSYWATHELNLAVNKGKRIIPIMVNNATPSDLPDIISDKLAVDISKNINNLKIVYDSIESDKSVWNKLKGYLIND
ncbi:toll/interleukin-1 receptor domain-containing protein [Aeromonas caviae]|uniref:toll/interleukin-1 receptor domain-containing protein n=1 Tax=Aeromonas caviae TaxID=648 RepID=UPI002DD6466C|nr:toll/interleukin-1 receptor domain-containing protein [Aeromonas caviae]